MALQLKDLIAKAESKGIKAKEGSPSPFLKPWQDESVLFSDSVSVAKHDSTLSKNPINSNRSLKKEEQEKVSDNKPTTKRQQTDNKITTKWQQTDNKPTTKKAEKTKTDNKVASQPTTKVVTKWQQTDNKSTTNQPFSELIGLQRKLVIFIYNECKNTRSKVTRNLTLEYISSVVGHPKGSIKITLQRLEAKKIIYREKYKNGRGGWSRYSLDDNIFRDVLQSESDNKLTTKWQQTDNKVASQPTTEPTTTPPSSSSIYINTTTTEMPKEWDKIDFSLLSEIGFSKNHVMQLYKAKQITPQILQNSIEYFSFDLNENNKAEKIKTTPLGYFMGILKRSGVYTAPENYESQQDKALREMVERAKEEQIKRNEYIKNLKTIEFENWINEKTEDELSVFAPKIKQEGRDRISVMTRGALYPVFEKEVWDSKRKEFSKLFENKKEEIPKLLDDEF